MWLETHIREKRTTLFRTNWTFSLTLSPIAHLKSHPRTRFFLSKVVVSENFRIFYIGNRVSKFRRFSRIFMIFVQKKFNSKKPVEFLLSIFFYTEKVPRSFFTLAENCFIKRSIPEIWWDVEIFSKFENTKMITVFQKLTLFFKSWPCFQILRKYMDYLGN